MERTLKLHQEGGFTPAFTTNAHDLNAQLKALWKIARRGVSVFLHGESGSGKTLLAKDVHDASERASRPFVVVDCASLPPELIESELFGHKKGAFTSAVSDRTGLIETADGGTVFLDEISELPLALQAKLLRAVEKGRIRKVGCSEEIEVDVRWISATHGDLAELVGKKLFRLDLYYRLCQFTVHISPLRERASDITMLAEAFFESHDTSLEERCTPAAIRSLKEWRWPGNVRELLSVLEVTNALVTEAQIDDVDIRFERSIQIEGQGSSAASSFGENVGIRVGARLEDAERALIEATLRSLKGNKSATAIQLHISVGKLNNLIKKFNIRA